MNQIKTVALLALLTGLLVWIGGIIGGQTGMFMGLIMAAVMNLGSWFFSDKIALAAYSAQPVSPAQAPELHKMVDNLSQRAGIPTPAVYVIPTPAVNAFATGRSPQHAAVAVTEGILQLMPADELEAVIAHELSHIMNRDTLTQAVAATIGGAISYLAQMAMWFGAFSSNDENRPNPIALLMLTILAPIAATVVQMAISRTREFAADAGSAELTRNPRALANALQRLEMGARQIPMNSNPAFSPLLIIEPFTGQAFANLFATHPSTEARIQRLLELEQQMR
ncbi:MAG: M48 family metalloprotease [Oscillatoriales cyanobacterium C42_A2020_001]|nr:M48 family metalloprotease [Leptolyngbyaceae cyanobacterium C42_A2020_001]